MIDITFPDLVLFQEGKIEDLFATKGGFGSAKLISLLKVGGLARKKEETQEVKNTENSAIKMVVTSCFFMVLEHYVTILNRRRV
jgi:hypothetical protein